MLNENKTLEMIRAKKLKKQKGASMIEYALVVGGVAAVAAVLFGGTGGGEVGSAISEKVKTSVGIDAGSDADAG